MSTPSVFLSIGLRATVFVCSLLFSSFGLSQNSPDSLTGIDPFSVCNEDETPTSCDNKLLEAYRKVATMAVSQVTNSATDQVDANVRSSNTGATEVVQNISSTEDFLNKLAMSLVSSNDGDGQLQTPVFELTNFLGFDTSDGYKIEARLNHATPFEPLTQFLNDNNLASQIDSLEGSVGNLDSVLLTFHYSPTGSLFGNRQNAFGRNYDQYGNFFESLVKKVTEDVAPQQGEVDIALVKRSRKLQQEERFQAMFTGAGPDTTFNDLVKAGVSQDAVNEYIRDTGEVIRADSIYTRAFTDQLDQTGFYTMSRLIDNQPQLYFSVQGHVNDEVVGPDDLSIKLTYEKGFYNINRLRKRCDPDDFRKFANCYRGFVDSNKTAIEGGNRLGFSLEYKKTNAYTYSVPGQNLTFNADKAKSLISSLTYSRFIGNIRTGNTRMDINLSYDDVSGDPMRQGRGLGSVVLTHKLANGVAASIGLVYANKPEFRGNVDEELSAKLGLNYKLEPPSGALENLGN